MKYKIIFLLILGSISYPTWAFRWNGKYLSLSGRYILEINDDDQVNKTLSFNIYLAKNYSRIKSAFAFIHDDLAITSSLSVKDECITELQNSKKGIFVSDFCGGEELINEFYFYVTDFYLDTLKILPLRNKI